MASSGYTVATKQRIVEYVKQNPRKTGSAIAREMGLLSKRVNQFLYYESEPFGLVGMSVRGRTWKVWVFSGDVVESSRPARRVPERAEPQAPPRQEEHQRRWDQIDQLTITQLEDLFARHDYELAFSDDEKAAMATRLQQLKANEQKSLAEKRQQLAQHNGVVAGVAAWFMFAVFLMIGGAGDQRRGIGLFMVCPIGWIGCAAVASGTGAVNRQRVSGSSPQSAVY